MPSRLERISDWWRINVSPDSKDFVSEEDGEKESVSDSILDFETPDYLEQTEIDELAQNVVEGEVQGFSLSVVVGILKHIISKDQSTDT
jgi:hypothetical protein